MANDDESLAVKDAVYKLQLYLLDGIENQDQLFAAGSVMARRDYEDIVTERTIANLCGYPLCRNPLPSDRPRKGRYRISLKEHKVYDQHETYMFCATTCVVNSRAFAAYLQDKRPSTLNTAKLSAIVRMFEDLSLDNSSSEKKEKKSVENKVGMNLKIHEKTDTQAGAVSLEEWLGPSNAVEGYVPQRDRNKSMPRMRGGGPVAAKNNSSSVTNFGFSERDFMSDIIMNDGYGISKPPPGTVSDSKSDDTEIHKSVEDQFANMALSSTPNKKKSGKKSSKSKRKKSREKYDHVSKESCATSNTCQSGFAAEKEIGTGKATAISTETTLKPSLKSAGAKKLNCSVTWADKKTNEPGSGKLCEVKSIADGEGSSEMLTRRDEGGDDDALRVASAQACAMALRQAAEAVASGSSDIADAVTEAGIVVLPEQPNVNGEETMEDIDIVKWPRKPGDSESDVDDPEDSLFDDTPEGFSLTLSPFATMFGAIFEWITSCSLAYIYGRDVSHYVDYLIVNGREYPRKVIMEDGRSSEIMKTLGGCLERALPALVADIRLSIPITDLEKEMGRLLETMTFADALPAFRMKQWRLIVLLFLEALSVCRIPALTLHLSNNRRVLLGNVLDGAEINVEQYEAMRDILIPLGRAPHFSSQSGA